MRFSTMPNPHTVLMTWKEESGRKQARGVGDNAWPRLSDSFSGSPMPHGMLGHQLREPRCDNPP